MSRAPQSIRSPPRGDEALDGPRGRLRVGARARVLTEAAVGLLRVTGDELPDEVAAREVTRRDATRAQREDGALEVTDVLEPARVRAHVIDGGPSGASGRVRAVSGGRDA